MTFPSSQAPHCFLFSAKIVGSFHELNVHNGVYVGSMGDFNEIFLGNQKNFRGCMEDVYFNGIDVLRRAQVRMA